MAEQPQGPRWFEDIAIHEFHVLGQHCFEHTRDSLLPAPPGGTDGAVDPWEVASQCMRAWLDFLETGPLGRDDPRRGGAGLGLRDLRWYRPVQPGETLTYTYEVIAKDPRRFRGRWSAVRAMHRALDGSDSPVFSCCTEALTLRRPRDSAAEPVTSAGGAGHREPR
jgi:acyl dehydratase